ncbi:MAG: alpha/beta hydrolase fold domain-containing protein [Gaiellaceae bacterium]
MALDPQIAVHLENAAKAGAFPVAELTPAQAREQMHPAYVDQFGPADPVGSVVDFTLPSPGGVVPIRVYTPEGGGAGLPLYVYCHGGGWVIGSLETHDGLCRTLAARSGAIVAAVDYRLAPEHRCPAALEDAWAATVWLAERGDSLGAAAGEIAVGGDSAGANLAAGVALRAREHGLGLRLQLLAFPVVDCDLTRASYIEHDAIGPSIAAMDWFWDHYIGPGGERTNPAASPLRVTDLSGLAPALVLTAQGDTLRDEGDAYAARLKQAGVDVEHHCYPGQIHCFYRLGAVTDQASLCLDDCAAALRRAFSTD